MKDITILGVDLAKSVFQVHGMDSRGTCVLRKRLSRAQFKEFIITHKPCQIGIEACTGAHYWARFFKEHGHTVKMMAPQFVKPYVKSNKNDRNDSEGIAEACSRPGIKCVPIKTLEQQDILLLHRAREQVKKHQTAQANQIRGLLAEYGIVIAKGINQLKGLLEILEKNAEKLTERSTLFFKQLYEEFQETGKRLDGYTKAIEKTVKDDVRCQEVMKLEGIGPITASAIVATIGDANVFKKGREVSAWLGLVPKQHSSGNTIRLGSISKRGDRYVRTLLIHGARAALKRCEPKVGKHAEWMQDKKTRLGFNKAAVALANKNARIIWALLATGECYRPRCQAA